jgi:Secretion system C-terminal sorting domain
MKKTFFSLLFFCGFLAPVFALTDICDITIGPDSKVAAFANGENVTVMMGYSTDEAAGVRIFARPYTNGSLSPGYAASGSGLYMGTGTATGTFTISSGNVLVNEIRIEVFASDNTTLLRRLWVPVRFRFGSAGVHHFSFSSNTPVTSLLLGENFTTSFQYNVTHPGGVRVFVRPFTNGSLTPGYGASGSGVYTGSGSTSSNFNIASGKNVHVDALRVQVLNADQSVLLDEFFIPVNLYFSTVKITDIVPQGGNFPYNNENRMISYNYSTTEAGGVRIFPRPWTNGALTPAYSASGSGIYTGSGAASGTFTITSGNQRVDHTRIQVTNADQSEVLLLMYYPVEYTFGNFLVESIELCPASPARLENGSKVNIKFGYYNDQGVDTRIFVRPITNGNPTPGYAASGSGLYAAGGGTGNANFTISSGNQVVDQLRFQITNADQSAQLAEYFIPVKYVFNGAFVSANSPSDVVESISIFPNPAVDNSNLSVLLKENQQVHVSVTDLSGRQVLDFGTRNVFAQTQEQWQINSGNSLPNGTYVVLVEGENFRESRKLVVVR